VSKGRHCVHISQMPSMSDRNQQCWLLQSQEKIRLLKRMHVRNVYVQLANGNCATYRTVYRVYILQHPVGGPQLTLPTPSNLRTPVGPLVHTARLSLVFPIITQRKSPNANKTSRLGGHRPKDGPAIHNDDHTSALATANADGTLHGDARDGA
jgi:hypothetical protein